MLKTHVSLHTFAQALVLLSLLISLGGCAQLIGVPIVIVGKVVGGAIQAAVDGATDHSSDPEDADSYEPPEPLSPEQQFAVNLEEAECGNLEAQWSVGARYWMAMGPERDLVQSYKWYSAAIENDHASSDQKQLLVSERNQLELAMSEVQITNAERIAATWRSMDCREYAKFPTEPAVNLSSFGSDTDRLKRLTEYLSSQKQSVEARLSRFLKDTRHDAAPALGHNLEIEKSRVKKVTPHGYVLWLEWKNRTKWDHIPPSLNRDSFLVVFDGSKLSFVEVKNQS